MIPFILASASPRRLALLKQAGLEPAEILAQDVDETPHKSELPYKYALRCALTKLRAATAQRPKHIILAADTVVACGRRILPKADTDVQARTCLQLLSGRRHRVYTAVALCDVRGERTRLAMTAVRFKRLSAREIDEYIATKEWQHKAGGYALQGRAAAFIPWIGGAYDNVIGLPLYETVQLLTNAKPW